MASSNGTDSLAGNTEDDELTLPRASINKMIKELVPSVRIANEARELVLNCCTEFIHLLSSEANEICNQLNKKTINAEHVLEGEKTLYAKYLFCLYLLCMNMFPRFISKLFIVNGINSFSISKKYTWNVLFHLCNIHS